MELITFALLLLFVGALTVALGSDSRPSEQDHLRNL
jgi:hypothetical protein